jgi:signal transduction histidine kinase
MDAYFLLPLGSGLACLVFAVLILAREPSLTSSRVLAALLAGAAWWGVCDALWSVTDDPERALALVRLSAPGWVASGPLALHLLLHGTPGVPAALRRLVPLSYAGALVALALEWASPWMHRGVHPVPWGFAYDVGPGFVVWYAATVALSVLGSLYAQAGVRASGSPADRSQRPWMGAGIAIPLCIGSVSDGLLPILGVDVPRVGALSFALLGAVVTATFWRFGYSLLAPGSLAAPVLGALRDGVALATPEGRLRYANPSLAVLLGAPLVDLLDRPVAAFLPDAPVAPPRDLREHECELASPTLGRVPVALSATLLWDRRARLIGVVLLIRDLREVVGLRNRLLTSARLAAVGQLAAGIAHEINNPLAYIGSNLRALREQWLALAEGWRGGREKPALDEVFDEGLAMLDESLEGVDRTAAIVRDVRVFSHAGGDARERLDPNDLVERALRVAEPHVRHRARIERALGAVPAVEGSRRELEQVLLNLVINAAQAIAPGAEGVVRVSTSQRADGVEIGVADNGCGIAPEVIERIFDPFFTTKAVGEGTGLGLSISHEIVRRHGGRLRVHSTVGRGTEVGVLLPLAPDPGPDA